MNAAVNTDATGSAYVALSKQLIINALGYTPVETPASGELFTLQAATSGRLGGIKSGYVDNGSNVHVEMDGENAFVNVTSAAIKAALGYTPVKPVNTNGDSYILPIARENNLGGVQLGYIPTGVNSAKQLPLMVDSDGNAYVELTNSAVTGAYKYVLPQASSELGGIKVGYTNNGNRVGVQLDSDGQAFVELTSAAIQGGYKFVLEPADTNKLGGIKPDYVDNGKNIKVQVESNGNGFVTLTKEAITAALGITEVASKNDITDSLDTYNLPIAAPAVRGGIKTNFTTNIDAGNKILKAGIRMDGEHAYAEISLSDLEALGVISTTNVNSTINNITNSSEKWVTEAEYNNLQTTGQLQANVTYYIYE